MDTKVDRPLWVVSNRTLPLLAKSCRFLARKGACSKRHHKRDNAADVEGALGKARRVNKVPKDLVRVFEVDALIGSARGAAAPDGRIYMFSAFKTDMSVIGEELMHLHRWTSGFPKMHPLQPAIDGRYSAAIHNLEGHFEDTHSSHSKTTKG